VDYLAFLKKNMKNKLLPVFITTIFIIIFLFLYKGLQNSNIYTPEVKINNKIPSFSGELFYEEKIIDTSDLFKLDKIYLVNIWSSWCVPCRQEHPLLMSLKKSDNIELIGINYKDTKINAKNFLSELGDPYRKIIFDKKGINAIEWGAYGVPESFLIKDGIIIKRYVGPLNQKLFSEINQLIK
jgi:cytochrome c biogenesis protein CcmG/thiol:disulfide interchange protein DsbE